MKQTISTIVIMLVVVVAEMVVILLKHSEVYEYNCGGGEVKVVVMIIMGVMFVIMSGG